MDLLHFFTSLDSQLGSMIAAHGNLIYLILFSIVLCEIGFLPLFFLPGDPLIFITGSFAKLGSLNLPAMMAILACAAFFGNLISYRIGSAIGERIDSHQYRWINRKALEKPCFLQQTWSTDARIVTIYCSGKNFCAFSGRRKQNAIWQIHGSS